MTEESKTAYVVEGTAINPEKGLTSSQVEEMRSKFGVNALTPPERDPWWKQFLEKFNDLTIQILLVAAVVSLIMTWVEINVLNDPNANYYDSIGIFFAVFLATTVGYLSECKSGKEFEKLNEVKEDIFVKVTRDAKFQTVGIKDLVVGDVIHINMGDKVPADGVIIDCQNLAIDEAMLTGESVPANKKHCSDSDLSKADESARVSKGTMISDGHGIVIVTAVGDKTMMGKIAEKLAENDNGDEETPLKQKLARLAKQISVAGVAAAILIFTIMAIEAMRQSHDITAALQASGGLAVGLAVASLVIGYILMKTVLSKFFGSMDMELDAAWSKICGTVPMVIGTFIFSSAVWAFLSNEALKQPAMHLLSELLVAFVVAVTIIVVAVPEGLPMMVTICLALNMMKMAKQNCLVRRLIASETIGSATVICTDKTGTLTENKMTPVWFFVGMNKYEGDSISDVAKAPEWTDLARNISVNSEAQLEEKDGKIVGIGNATECALIRFLHGLGISYKAGREKYAKIWQLDYNSQRKKSIVVINVDDKDTCYIKGAPERVIEACSHVSINGKIEELDARQRDIIQKAIEEASAQALRLIAFSQKTVGKFDTESAMDTVDKKEYVLMALVGIQDPLRKEVPGAVATCHKAGIEVKMITGDALPTAKAIAKGAGILTEGGLYMTSKEFNEISDEELPEKAKKLQVLARSTPMDKLRLVKALHKVGDVVAMTGDGTNDAPALKAADVGLSMGITGTEVAKEASDVVLVDDNFKSILTGVWWGRTLYQNIQRFLQFQLTVNVVALLAAFFGPILGCDLPLTVPQLLWVNIIMDTFAALALSTDPPRANSMDRKPIPRTAHIITPSIALNMVLVGIFQLIVLYTLLLSDIVQGTVDVSDPASKQKLTVFFTTFVLFQFWNIFNCRTLRHDESPLTGLSENKLFLGIVAAIFFGQVIMVQIGGPVGEIFRTVPLSAAMWLKILALTFSVIPVGWVVRLISNATGIQDKTFEYKEDEDEKESKDENEAA